MAVWTAMKTWIAGAILTAAEFNTYVRDNMENNHVGHADADGKLTGGSFSRFSGLHLRTHPDADLAPAQVTLIRADEILFNDGFRLRDVTNLTANLAASGAGGLDTGAESASRWYEAHAIRKSSDGTRALILHRALNYLKDQEQATATGAHSLRSTSSVERLAQGFQTSVTGLVEFVDLTVAKVGTPTGRVWLTIEADAAGSPSGTPLATSDKLDVSLFSTTQGWARFTFSRAPLSVTLATQYHLVMYGDFTINGASYFNWNGNGVNAYASGVFLAYNGSAWSSIGGLVDAVFRIYVTQNDTALTMPAGYDQSCRVGWFYNDASSNLLPMVYRERRMTHLSFVSAYNAAAATPVLVDMSALIPPVSGYFSGSIFLNTACTAGVFGASEGYRADVLGSRLGGAGVLVIPTGGVAIESPPVFTRTQAVYVRTSAGNISLGGGSFEW